MTVAIHSPRSAAAIPRKSKVEDPVSSSKDRRAKEEMLVMLPTINVASLRTMAEGMGKCLSVFSSYSNS